MNSGTVGKGLIGLGLILLLYACNMPVSIDGSRTVNLHAMSERQNTYILGGLFFLAGIILFSLTKQKSASTENTLGNSQPRNTPQRTAHFFSAIARFWKEVTKTGIKRATGDLEFKDCTFCAEKIKKAAIVCRYCGRDLPPMAQEHIEPDSQLSRREEALREPSEEIRELARTRGKAARSAAINSYRNQTGADRQEAIEVVDRLSGTADSTLKPTKLVASISEPQGVCPNCDSVILLNSLECPICKAQFSGKSLFKIRPI